MKPKDEFTQWCESKLKDMQSSIDGRFTVNTTTILGHTQTSDQCILNVHVLSNYMQ